MSQSVPFSRMMAFAFSSESSPPDCIWQIVCTLLRATASPVGYFSRSQFTREYRRLFGAPPFRDVEQIRQQSQPAEL